MNGERALIVGGGIGGLTAALALRQVGFDPAVLERAAALREAGAGISLWSNAVLALRRLGVGEAVEAAGTAAVEGSLRTWRGDPLGPEVGGELEKRFGAPLIVIHRATLQAILREAVGAAAIRLGSEVVAVEADADGAEVRLADGSLERGDLVIGADGLRSHVRRAVVGDGDPRYSGYTAWRGVVSLDARLASEISLGEFWGRSSLFGAARLPGSQAYWWASVTKRDGSRLSSEAEKQALLRRFGAWHRTVPALIDATPAEAIIKTPLYDRRPIARWTDGRLALLGDAAHPMLPNLGQGAGQAIEDGVVLADVLAGVTDVAAALQRYGAVRAPHAEATVRRSRQVARLGHLANPLATGARNAIMRRTSGEAALRRLETVLAGTTADASCRGHDGARKPSPRSTSAVPLLGPREVSPARARAWGSGRPPSGRSRGGRSPAEEGSSCVRSTGRVPAP